MVFTPTTLDGVWLIGLECVSDERGFFARSWCCRTFEEQGLNPRLSQCNVSFNRQKGTLRGMHWQHKPHSECKLVRCTQGAVFDVVVDLRINSATYRQWIGFELSADNRNSLYIPEGCAHGFQTLTDNSEIFYQMSREYEPNSSDGVRWDDPTLAIQWPITKSPIVSLRDQNLRLLEELA